MEQPILDFLKESLKLKEGSCEVVAGSYARYGFLLNPFSQYNSPLATDFNELFIGRKKEIEEISKILVRSIMGTGADIALVGPTGVGSRSIVSVLKFFLRTEKKESKENSIVCAKLHRIIERDLSEFSPQVRQEVKEEIKEGFEDGKTTVIATAFSDLRMPLLGVNNFGERTLETIRKIIYIDMDFLDRVSYINPWAVNSWYWIKKEESSTIKDYEHIFFIEPFSSDEVVKILQARIDFFKIQEEKIINLFTKDILQEIAEMSGGFPRFALEYACFLLDYCAENEKNIAKKDVTKILKRHGFLSYNEIKEKFQKIISSKSVSDVINKINHQNLKRLKEYLCLKDDDKVFQKDPSLSMKIKKLKYGCQISKDILQLINNDEDLFYKVKFQILNLKKESKKGDIYRKIIQILLALNGHNITPTAIHNFYSEVSKQTISKKLAEMKNTGLLKSGDVTVKKDNRTKIYSINEFVRCVFENEYLLPQVKM